MSQGLTSQNIDTFLFFLRETERQYHIAEAEVQESEDETQDILHSLELQEHDYHEYAKLSKELKSVRQRRRAAKDAIREAALVLDWAENNRPIIKSLERLLGEVRKAEKNTNNRIYTPKIRKKENAE